MYSINAQLIENIYSRSRKSQAEIADALEISNTALYKTLHSNFSLRRWMQLAEATNFSMGSFIVGADGDESHHTLLLDWSRPVFHMDRLYYDYHRAVKVDRLKLSKRLPTQMKQNSEKCLDRIYMNEFLQMVFATHRNMAYYVEDDNGIFPIDECPPDNRIPKKMYDRTISEKDFLLRAKEETIAMRNEEIDNLCKKHSESQSLIEDLKQERDQNHQRIKEMERQRTALLTDKRSIIQQTRNLPNSLLGIMHKCFANEDLTDEERCALMMDMFKCHIDSILKPFV